MGNELVQQYWGARRKSGSESSHDGGEPDVRGRGNARQQTQPTDLPGCQLDDQHKERNQQAKE